MAALFPDQLDAITNTKRIAEMCDLELPLHQTRIPLFPVPDGETVESWLGKECQRGLEWRYGTVTPELQERLDYELGVITSMGYAGYFLIVADFIRFAREQGIQTTCRGSAPGSIVTYTLGITPVDPIAYGLPFERFLNPDRVTMPDIDVDFQDDRRDEVIAYVSRKYGQDHVAQIITFGTMLARAAIRDVGRVLGHSYGEVDRVAKAVPNQLGIRLEEALETAPQLREQYDSEPGVKRIIDFARQLEGVARNASTHAAGVVISDEPLTELMPLQKATNSDSLMTQYEMHAIEALGLLKFDFLGLSNLTILKNAVDLIRAHRGIEIDLDNIPLDDATTFELLSTGETTGIFQLESAGMRRYVRELRPTSVFDLAAMVALYRPGPMDNIPAYIRRKHGQEPVTYLHPLLEPFLERTYGIFVYQEDIMAAAIALGGFTGPEADTLGYAIRKKKSTVLRAQKEKFVTRAAERGVPPQTIDAVFKAFEPFERYGFNKAHATCYGLIAYQTAYLKANYTVDYMASVLSAFRDNEEKVAAAVAECRRLGIEVRPPSVGRSQVEFTVEDEAIRFGLLAVKNVGQGAIESIIAAREAEGPFKSLGDLCRRIDLRLANRKVLESLAKVGALNAFGHPAQVLEGLDDAIAAGAATQRDLATGQTSLFDVGAADSMVMERALPNAVEAPVRERLRWEKELLGLYLSEHPMGEVADRVGEYVTAYSGDLRSDETLDGQRLVVGGIVVATRTVITRTRSTMSVVTLEDLQGSIEVVVFPRLYEQTGPIWQEGAILLVAGRVDHRGEEVSLLADVVVPWDEAVTRGPEAFAREVAAGDRGAPRRRQPVAVGPGRRSGGRSARRRTRARPSRWRAADRGQRQRQRLTATANGANGAGFDPRNVPLGRRPEIEYVSPLRGGAVPEAGPLERAGRGRVDAARGSLRRIRSATYPEPPGRARADRPRRRAGAARRGALPCRRGGGRRHGADGGAPPRQRAARAVRGGARVPGRRGVQGHHPARSRAPGRHRGRRPRARPGRPAPADAAPAAGRLRRRPARGGPAPPGRRVRPALGRAAGLTARRRRSRRYQRPNAGWPGPTGTKVARPRRGHDAVDLDRRLDGRPIRRATSTARPTSRSGRSDGVGRRNRTEYSAVTVEGASRRAGPLR